MLVMTGIYIYFVTTEFNIQGLYSLVFDLVYVGILGIFGAVLVLVGYRIYKGE